MSAHGEVSTYRWREIQDALELERRLLEGLREVLLQQRDGLAANDCTVVDDSVHAAQRVLRTLGQARIRRRTLLQLVVRGEVRLAELEVALPGAPHDVFLARDALLLTVAELERDLTINRTAIHGAMEIGDQLIRALAGAGEKPPIYSAGGGGEASPPSGVLFSHTV